MPTAAKLVAALCFAALGWYISGLITPLFDHMGRQFAHFERINATIGFLLGWLMVGKRAGQGMTAAIGVGLTCAVFLAVCGLLFHSTAEMIRKSLRDANVYDGAMEAVIDVFAIAFKFATIINTSEIVMAFLIGGIIAGMVSEVTSRRAS